MVDGITSWMKSTYSAMDLDGLKISTTAFEDCPRDVFDSVHRCGLDIVTVPDRKKHPIQYMVRVHGLLRDGHFDVIHVCCNSALAAFELVEAKRRRITMRIAHSHNTQCEHPFLNNVLGPMFRWSVTDRYACGVAAGKWLFGTLPFTVIPNGKDLPIYTFSTEVRETVRGELGLLGGEIVYGHVGAFNEQKNHEKLIDIFSELYRRNSSCRLVLVGEGRLMSDIQGKVKALGIEKAVRFLGRRDDVPRLLNAMDCMVFPSLHEGLPNVVLEWQLNGLPVVMSDAITDECVFTPLVRKLSIESSVIEWADLVDAAVGGRDRMGDSSAAIDAAAATGYDIRDNAAMLRQLYLEGAKRCNLEK